MIISDDLESQVEREGTNKGNVGKEKECEVMGKQNEGFIHERLLKLIEVTHILHHFLFHKENKNKSLIRNIQGF